MEKYHHYCRGRVATQFCSFSQKKSQEWMASHQEIHFDAFHTLCTALEYARDKFFECWNFNPRAVEYVNVEFCYPVLVVQGELIEVQSRRKSLKLRQVKHVQYRRSWVWRGQEKDYQIDVVTEDFFPKYLSVVEKELGTTAIRMRARKGVIQDSIERIVRTAKRLRSPDKIRAAMEYSWPGLAL